jgi:hypothetical protein
MLPLLLVDLFIIKILKIKIMFDTNIKNNNQLLSKNKF